MWNKYPINGISVNINAKQIKKNCVSILDGKVLDTQSHLLVGA